jgi:hypothetical protein
LYRVRTATDVFVGGNPRHRIFRNGQCRLLAAEIERMPARVGRPRIRFVRHFLEQTAGCQLGFTVAFRPAEDDVRRRAGKPFQHASGKKQRIGRCCIRHAIFFLHITRPRQER